MKSLQEYWKRKADKLLAQLSKRRMTGYYCETVAEAKEMAMSFVSEGMTVAYGGSVSISECGVLDELRGRTDITLLDQNTCDPTDRDDVLRKAFSSDVYFMSTNALTADGKLVNIDNTGNRVASLIFGPKKVVVIAGVNKIEDTLDSAVIRARNVASPANCIRMGRKTPCAVTGNCENCYSPEALCNHLVVTRRVKEPERVILILVGEALGY